MSDTKVVGQLAINIAEIKTTAIENFNAELEKLIASAGKLDNGVSMKKVSAEADKFKSKIKEARGESEKLRKSLGDAGKNDGGLERGSKLLERRRSLLKELVKLERERGSAVNTENRSAIDAEIAAINKELGFQKMAINTISKKAKEQLGFSALLKEEETAHRRILEIQTRAANLYGKRQKRDQSGAKELKETQSAYSDLTKAYQNYDKARKKGDTGSMDYWAKAAAGSKGQLASIAQTVSTLNIEEGARQKIQNLIQQASEAERDHAAAAQASDVVITNMLNKMVSFLTRMATMALRNMWREAISYVSEYNDLLNQIRIVSGYSEEQANRLGASYRQMAQDMSVTSREIAEAAVEYWRQGLPEDQVNERLQSTIKYAKISGLEFDEAAELMTSATNTFGISAEKVADTWAVQGDESASGANEIGKAMQKASASASEFGLTFEWLGAYITTISEKTREAPEVIGTSLNAMMGRMHSIKQKGFNEEDETKINDVAKALSTVNIALLDSEGNWRDMNLIFDDIAGKWTEMTDKQRGYISTTMAGTRQQNRFITLMNDMSKGVEGQSRAYELYEKAIGAAGTATEKYAIYQESVTAAQDRMTTAFEGFYSLMSADWMIGFYDSVSWVVQGITNAADASNGWALILPVLIGGILALTTAFKGATVGAATFGAALSTFALAHPIILGVAAAFAVLSAGVGIFNAIASSSGTSMEKIADLNAKIAESTKKIEAGTKLKELKKEYEELAGKEKLTNDELERMNTIKAEMTPLLEMILGETGAYESQEAAIIAAEKALKSYNEERNKDQQDKLTEAAKDYDNTYADKQWEVDDYEQNYRSEIDATKERIDELKSIRKDIEDEASKFIGKGLEIPEYLIADKDTIDAEINQLEKRIKELDGIRKDIENRYNTKLSEQFSVADFSGYIETSGKAGQEAANAFLSGWNFDEFQPSSIKEFQTMLDSIMDSPEVSKAKENYDEVIKNMASGSGATYNDLIAATNEYQTAILKASALQEEFAGAVDFTNTVLGNNQDVYDNIRSTLAEYGTDLSKFDSLNLNEQGRSKIKGYIELIKADGDLPIEEAGAKFTAYLQAMADGNKDILEQMEKDAAEAADIQTTTASSVEDAVQNMTNNIKAATDAAAKQFTESVNKGKLEAAQKDNFMGTIDMLSNTLKTKGLRKFQEEWVNLGEPLQNALMSAHPEIMKFVSDTSQIQEGAYDSAEAIKLAADGVDSLASAMDRASKTDFKNMQEAIGIGDSEPAYKFEQRSKSRGYKNIAENAKRYLETDGVQAMQDYLTRIATIFPTTFANFVALDDSITALGLSNADAAESGKTLNNVLEGTADKAKLAEEAAKSAAEMFKDSEYDKKYSGDADNHYIKLMKDMKRVAYEGEDAFNDFWNSMSSQDQSGIIGIFGNVHDEITKIFGDNSIIHKILSFDKLFSGYDDKRTTVTFEETRKSLEDLNDEYERNARLEESVKTGFSKELGNLSRMVADFGLDGGKSYLSVLFKEGEQFFGKFMETYPKLIGMFGEGATDQDAEDLTNEAINKGLDDLKKQVEEKQKLIEINKQLEKSEEQMYRPAMQLLKDAYAKGKTEGGATGGIQAFNEMKEIIGDEQWSGILEVADTVGVDLVAALEEAKTNGRDLSDILGEVLTRSLSTAVQEAWNFKKATDEAVAAAEQAYTNAIDQGKLEQAQKDGFSGILKSLGDSLTTGGYKAFMENWNGLGKPLQDAILAIDPALANIVAKSADLKDNEEGAAAAAKELYGWSEKQANALANANLRSMQEMAGATPKDNWLKKMQDSNFSLYTKTAKDYLKAGNNDGQTKWLIDLSAIMPEVFAGFMGLGDGLGFLADSGMSAEKKLGKFQNALLGIEAASKESEEMFKKSQYAERYEGDADNGYVKMMTDMKYAAIEGKTAFKDFWDAIDKSDQQGIVDIYGDVFNTIMGFLDDDKITYKILPIVDFFKGIDSTRSVLPFKKATEDLREMNKEYAKTKEIEEASKSGFASDLGKLEGDILGDEKFGAKSYLGSMYATQKERLDALLEKYPYLIELYQDELSLAQQLEIVNRAQKEGLTTIKEQVVAKQKQIEIDKRLEKSAENMYKPALELLKEAYKTGGDTGLAEMWEMLPDDQIEGLITTYGSSLVTAFTNASAAGGDLVAELEKLQAMQIAADPLVGLTTSLTNAKTGMDALTSAQQEQAQQGFITYETYKKLIEANSDYGNVIENVGGLMRINADEAAKMTSAQLESVQKDAWRNSIIAMQEYAKAAKQLAIEKLTLQNMEFQGKDTTEQEKRIADMEKSQGALGKQIDSYKAITGEINGMTSAYYRYLEALESANPGAQFDQIHDSVSKLSEALKSGRMFTDDVDETARYVKGDGYTLSSDPKKRRKEIQAMIKEVEGYYDNYKKLAKDFNKLEGVNLDGMKFTFAEGTDLKTLSEEWGLSPEIIEDMLKYLTEFGYEIPLDDIKIKVNNFELEWGDNLEDPQKAIADALSGNGPKMGDRGDKVKGIQQFLVDNGYSLDTFGVDGIWGAESQKALKAFLDDPKNTELIEKLKEFNESWNEAMEGINSGEPLDVTTLNANFLALKGALGTLTGLDQNNITPVTDLIKLVSPPKTEGEETGDTKELESFIETYKDLLELLTTIDMDEVSKNMPSAEQMQDVMSKALESGDAEGKAADLTSEMSKIGDAVDALLNTSKEDKKSLDDAGKTIQDAITGFFEAYSSLAGGDKTGDGGASLKAAFDKTFADWNPFAAFSGGISSVNAQMIVTLSDVNTLSGAEIGNLGSDKAVTALQDVVRKLQEIKDFTIPDKTFKVTPNQQTTTTAKGSDGEKSGRSFVAEEGRELIYRKNKGVVELANTMQETVLEPGDRVYTNAETEKILSNNDMTTMEGYAKGKGKGGKLNVKKILEQLEEVLSKLSNQTSYFEAAEEYHNVRGEFDSVAHYIKEQLEVSEKREQELRDALEKLNQKRLALEEKQSKYKEGSKKWKKYQEQIDGVTDSMTQYETQLIETMTEQERMNQEIDEANEKIKQSQIDIRNELEQALRDRDALNERMLQGRIEMEDLIIQTLQENAEKEKEIAEEAADGRIEALQAEMDKIDELLEARKKLSEDEDKQEELSKLEGQLSRISIDPTRSKERMELEEKIADLRKEIAWDLAEEEAEAQKKAIEEQIKNIEDYKEEISKEDEDEDANRADLIAQAEEILRMTDDEIVEWLKKNNKEYSQSTAAMQESIANEWQTTLDDMRGVTRTYWAEVEEIIAQGDEAIINTLVGNREDYKNAGKLQAEALLEGWRETLAGAGDITTPGGAPDQPSIPITEDDPTLNRTPTPDPEVEKRLGGKKKNKTKIKRKYDAGGYVKETGPVWVDGTPMKPEVFLDNTDTKLIASLTEALRASSYVNVPSLNAFAVDMKSMVGSGAQIGDININVESLDTDQDLEEVARKVAAAIYDGAQRGIAPRW